jgi:hypothetical protein
MDFPTALRYLMAGRTIRMQSEPRRLYCLGTLNDTCQHPCEKKEDNPHTILHFWQGHDPAKYVVACFPGHDCLATDWELVE